MNISVRKATETDFESVFSLVHELAVFQGTPERIQNSVKQMIQEKEFFQCFVAETQEHEIVGMASFFFAYYTWVGKSLFLDDLYVRQSHRGQKIGSSLLSAVVDLARPPTAKEFAGWYLNGTKMPSIFTNLSVLKLMKRLMYATWRVVRF